jgi:hypothetical protein
MHYEFLIDKSKINETKKIIDITHPEPNYKKLASLYWVGENNQQQIHQLAFSIDDINQKRFLSFDGYSFCLKLDKYDQDHIKYPSDGSTYAMKNGIYHYFNNLNPELVNLNYSINKNNYSTIMNNVSIFDEHYRYGAMINLRVSFEGDIEDNNLDGKVIILVSMDFPNGS